MCGLVSGQSWKAPKIGKWRSVLALVNAIIGGASHKPSEKIAHFLAGNVAWISMGQDRVAIAKYITKIRVGEHRNQDHYIHSKY